ncbi:MAG: hypothetical protein MUP70_04370 [Candidatus Aminicenantes bacterium]|nr:hypothetical protein [Candidatus Aminicenantes bacterium]
MNTDKQIYAVLSGDIVNSSQLQPKDVKVVMQRLRDGADKFEAVFPRSVFGKLDVFSGDGWQLVMKRYELSLRTALFLRAEVMRDEKLKIDTRVAVAWGTVDVDTMNPERVSESTGAAFTESGRLLKDMPKRSRLLLRTDKSLSDTPFLMSTVLLLDEMAAHWTPRQADTLALALLNHTQEEIADKRGKSQPTVHQALQTSGWRGIEEFLKVVEYRL